MDANGKRKLISFVDGFNLYYGLLRDNPDFKWLDLNKLIRMLFPHYENCGVKYFSAKVTDDHKKAERQESYWKALENSGVKIIPGRLEFRERECGVKECDFRVKKHRIPVEKMTDVNMALHITNDVKAKKPDAVCIISGDTDLIPALNMVRATHQCQKFIFIPCAEKMLRYRRIDEFELLLWTTKRLVEDVVTNCRFSDKIATPLGEIICPAGWLRNGRYAC